MADAMTVGMRRVVIAVRRLPCSATILACLALVGCAADVSGPDRWMRDSGGRTPEIVLRRAAGGVTDEIPKSPTKEAAGYAAAGTVGAIMLAIPTFGTSLLLIPRGVAEGARASERLNECQDRWRNAVGDLGPWLSSTFEPVPVVEIVGDALQRRTATRIHIVKSQATRTERIATLREIGARQAVPALFVVDLWVVINLSDKSRCGLTIVTSAHLDLQRLDKSENLDPPFVVRATKEIAVERMTTRREDQDHVREQLRGALLELSEQIAVLFPWRS